MEINKIYSADLLDIIFEGRNKDYGAYDLRKTYKSRLLTALSAMIATCLLLIITSRVAGENETDNKMTVGDVSIEPPPPKKEERPEKLPEPIAKPKPVKVEVIKFVVPKIVVDEEVKDPPPTIADVEQAVIGTYNQAGDKNIDFVAPPVEVISTGAGEALKNKEENYEGRFTKIEKEARFPGGYDAWKKFLERHLNSQVAADDGAPSGNYTVKVQFVVDKDGNVSNVTAIDVPKECPACGPEAVKVIKKSHKWEPAIQNGRPVTYQAIQHITFKVEDQ